MKKKGEVRKIKGLTWLNKKVLRILGVFTLIVVGGFIFYGLARGSFDFRSSAKVPVDSYQKKPAIKKVVIPTKPKVTVVKSTPTPTKKPTATKTPTPTPKKSTANCCSNDRDCLSGVEKCVGKSTKCSNSAMGGYCVKK